MMMIKAIPRQSYGVHDSKEFGAQNRIEGYALFATVAIPFAPRKSKGGSN